jgi:AAA+ ATPase superfamily predicted ATPase
MSYAEPLITAGKPVTGDQLIGRHKEIETINRYLDMEQSVVLMAPRRFGKTSLLLEMLRQRKEKGDFTASIDFFSTPDILSLAAEITTQILSNKKWTWSVYQLRTRLTELLRNLQFRQTIDQYDFILGFGNPQPDEWELLSESLKLIEKFAGTNKKKIVCGFDEFGDVEKLDGDRIIKLIRSVIQLQKESSYLFAGSYESVMNRIFNTKSSPFLRFARIIHLGPITPAEFTPFLTKVFVSNQIEKGKQLAQTIRSFTWGHPYYTQLIEQQAVLLNKASSQRHIAFDAILDESLLLENDYLAKL